MVEITRDGIVTKNFNQYVDDFESVFTQILGAGLSFQSTTPQTQIISILSQAFVDFEEAIAEYVNAFSIEEAIGVHLDALASLMGIKRRDAQRASVSVYIVGTAGTNILAATPVQAPNGDVYSLSEDISIPTGGRAIGIFNASAVGPVLPQSEDVNWSIDIEPVDGWSSAYGAFNFTNGTLQESDDSLRSRMLVQVGRNSTGGSGSINAGIASVLGVEKVRVSENDSVYARYIDGIRARPNSVLVAVKGGSSEGVAAAIAGAKALGVDTGTLTEENTLTPESVHDQEHNVRFVRASALPLEVAMSTLVKPNSGFPSGTGDDGIRNALSRYIASISLGSGITTNELFAPSYTVVGHIVQGLSVSRKDGFGDDAVTSIDVATSGSGYTSVPNITIDDPVGSSETTATAAAVMSVQTGTIDVTTGGMGYHADPSISVVQTGGSGAEGSVVLNPVTGVITKVDIDSGGSGYTAAPVVSISGGGGRGASAIAIVNSSGAVSEIIVVNGGAGYNPDNSPVTASIAAPASGTQASTPTVTVDSDGSITAITVAPGSGGAGYTATATATVSGGGGTGVDVIPIVSDAGGVVREFYVRNGGSGYSYGPVAAFVNGGGGYGVVASVVVGSSGDIESLKITSGGEGFTSVPTVEIRGGGGSGASPAVKLTVGEVVVTNGGTGYVSDTPPSVTIAAPPAGSGNTTATATATVGGIEDKDIRFHEELNLDASDVTITFI